jgi:hypothetical protein
MDSSQGVLEREWYGNTSAPANGAALAPVTENSDMLTEELCGCDRSSTRKQGCGPG